MSTTETRENWLRSHGLCASCKQPIAVHSTWYCVDCLEKMNEKQKARRREWTPEDHAHRNEIRRQRAAEKRAAGICTQCNRKAQPGKTLCTEHLIYSARWARKKFNANRYNEIGRCRICGEKPAEGKKLCPQHSAQMAEVMLKNRRSGNDQWRKDNEMAFLKEE